MGNYCLMCTDFQLMGELLLNGYRVSVVQDGKSSGNWLHNNVNVCNTSELHTSNG